MCSFDPRKIFCRHNPGKKMLLALILAKVFDARKKILKVNPRKSFLNFDPRIMFLRDYARKKFSQNYPRKIFKLEARKYFLSSQNFCYPRKNLVDPHKNMMLTKKILCSQTF